MKPQEEWRPPFEALRADVARLTDTISQMEARVPKTSENLLEDIRRVNGAISALNDKLSDLGLTTQRLRGDLSAQQGRLAHLLREVRQELPRTTAPASQHADVGLDRIYLDFEDVFRGPRREIKERQREYLPAVRQAGAGTRDRPIADLGCGRGEWLELLRDEGLEARGLDRNQAMLALCRQLGLNVLEGDALSYLRSLQDGSLGAITSFHMIEHMPFDDVIALVDEALRVLRTGGLLILETPNPGNLAVGASTFHLDPTHVRPIPHQVLQFFVEARGFCDVRIREVNPYPEVVRLPEEQVYGRRFNECFYGPQDYGLIACKP
jgi:O-antigen chain-terminating methyltransferase